MAPRQDSAAVRWLLGVLLRDSRIKSGKTLAQAAHAIEGSASKVSNMESGRYFQSPNDVERLLQMYEVERAQVQKLVELVATDNERTWWRPWQEVVPDWLRTFIGLEGFATAIFTYEPLVLPALLQTSEYAAATARSPRVRQDDVDHVAELRAERQRRLQDDIAPLSLHAVIEESVLHRPVGDQSTMERQLRHLVELAEQPNITMQVAPTNAGVHAAFTGKFDLLSFENFRDVVYVELMESAVYLQEPEKVRAYRLSANSLRGAAFSQQDSLDLIRSLISGY